MKHRSVDILVVIAATIVAVTLVFVVPADNVAGRILTLPLVLVLPGYALMSAVFPERSPGLAERLVFSLGLSLVIVILGGLVLNWTPFGLHASSWSVLLSSITLGASAVALVRRREQSISISEWSWGGHIGLSFRHMLLLGLAVVVLSGAIAMSIIGAARQPRPGFTQLWILPAGGTDPKNAVQLGVSNMEATAMEYNLNLNENGKVVKVWTAIDLRPDQKWEITLLLPPTRQAGAVKVEAELYRWDAPTTIYRQVVLWLGT